MHVLCKQVLISFGHVLDLDSIDNSFSDFRVTRVLDIVHVNRIEIVNNHVQYIYTLPQRSCTVCFVYCVHDVPADRVNRHKHYYYYQQFMFLMFVGLKLPVTEW